MLLLAQATSKQFAQYVQDVQQPIVSKASEQVSE